MLRGSRHGYFSAYMYAPPSRQTGTIIIIMRQTQVHNIIMTISIPYMYAYYYNSAERGQAKM